ncbi:oncomodulin-like [Gigantopelta aegis]|uniref:oncomodulin-like n=1 Tax=Gigantopelta aegis TaxID=1735272 RepID=UPI001B8877BB|nr:oncomodulin-like [Gigantopelta aegis]
MKLLFVLLLITCVAFQQPDAWPRFRSWRIRIPKPGPIGILGRDVARDLDTDQDGYLDETELENHLGERDVLDFIAALDRNGDNLLSIDEFNKQ